MKNKMLTAALALLFLGHSQTYAAQPPCDMQGLTSDAPRYNARACRGLDAYDAGDYQRAAGHFRAALSMNLFEFPNFELLPWLASAYVENGKMRAANRTMVEAEGAAALLRRELMCVENDDGFQLATETGEKVTSMSMNVQQAVVMRMCGGIYEALYSTDQALIENSLGAFFEKFESTSRKVKQAGDAREANPEKR